MFVVADLSQAFNDPRVSRLVQQLRENPSALPAVLGMLQQTNPQLLSVSLPLAGNKPSLMKAASDSFFLLLLFFFSLGKKKLDLEV